MAFEQKKCLAMAWMAEVVAQLLLFGMRWWRAGFLGGSPISK